MGRREEKKEELKRKILSGAESVFMREGFEMSTMEKIAAEANVGLGTAYNYFRSKEELFIQVMVSQTEKPDEYPVDPDLTRSPAEDLAERIIKQSAVIRRFSRNVWRTIIGISFNNMKKDNSLLSKLVQADLQAMDKIGQLIDNYKTQGILRTDEDTDLLVEMIYGMLFMQFMIFLYTDQLSYEDACERIRRGIRYILK